MNSDVKVVKGLNIAIIVLAALGILTSLLVAVLLGVAGVMIQDPAVQSSLSSQPNYYWDDSYYGSGMDPETALGLSLITSGVFIAIVVFALIVHVVSLIAGIFGLQSASDPSKNKTAFVLAIAGIVLNVLCGSLILLVLFIISAVFLNRVKNANATYTVEQPAQPAQPSTDVTEQPVQPAQPSADVTEQPVQPAQPSADAIEQPAQPQAPESSSSEDTATRKPE